MYFADSAGQTTFLFSSIKKYIPKENIEKHIKVVDKINRILLPYLSTNKIAAPVPRTWQNATKNADRPSKI